MPPTPIASLSRLPTELLHLIYIHLLPFPFHHTHPLIHLSLASRRLHLTVLTFARISRPIFLKKLLYPPSLNSPLSDTLNYPNNLHAIIAHFRNCCYICGWGPEVREAAFKVGYRCCRVCDGRFWARVGEKRGEVQWGIGREERERWGVRWRLEGGERVVLVDDLAWAWKRREEEKRKKESAGWEIEDAARTQEEAELRFS